MYIYLTKNIENGKIYIGQSTKTITESEKYLGSGIILKKALKKYGKNSFSKVILESNIESQKELDNLEVFYISLLKSTNRKIGYNISHGGLGGYKTSCKQIWKNTLTKEKYEEKMKKWKMKISKNSKKDRSKEWKENISKALKGHKHSESTKKKLSERKKGRKNKNKTKYILISNNKNEVVFKVDGYFKNFCKFNNLPTYVLINSYKRGGEPIYQNLSPQRLGVIKKNGNFKYKGWSAKIKEDLSKENVK